MRRIILLLLYDGCIIVGVYFEFYSIIDIFKSLNMDGYRIRDESKPHFVTFTVVDWGGPTFGMYFLGVFIEIK